MLVKLLDDLEIEVKVEVMEELKNKENPVIVKCTKCNRIWVDEL